METVFPYCKEHSKLFGKIYRQVVLVELIWGSERKIQRMYLDSKRRYTYHENDRLISTIYGIVKIIIKNY